MLSSNKPVNPGSPGKMVVKMERDRNFSISYANPKILQYQSYLLPRNPLLLLLLPLMLSAFAKTDLSFRDYPRLGQIPYKSKEPLWIAGHALSLPSPK